MTAFPFDVASRKAVADTRTFLGGAAAVGALYALTDRWSLAANVGSAWRPPNVSELYSFGVHHGTAQFEVGDPDLGTERSLDLSATLRHESALASRRGVRLRQPHRRLHLRARGPRADGDHPGHLPHVPDHARRRPAGGRRRQRRAPADWGGSRSAPRRRSCAPTTWTWAARSTACPRTASARTPAQRRGGCWGLADAYAQADVRYVARQDRVQRGRLLGRAVPAGLHARRPPGRRHRRLGRCSGPGPARHRQPVRRPVPRRAEPLPLLRRRARSQRHAPRVGPARLGHRFGGGLAPANPGRQSNGRLPVRWRPRVSSPSPTPHPHVYPHHVHARRRRARPPGLALAHRLQLRRAGRRRRRRRGADHPGRGHPHQRGQRLGHRHDHGQRPRRRRRAASRSRRPRSRSAPGPPTPAPSGSSTRSTTRTSPRRSREEAEEHLFRYAFQPSSAGTVTPDRHRERLHDRGRATAATSPSACSSGPWSTPAPAGPAR